jgi:hypothetical protein
MDSGPAQWGTGMLTVFELTVPFRWTNISQQECDRVIAKATTDLFRPIHSSMCGSPKADLRCW